MLRKFFTIIVCLVASIAITSAQTPPDNEIWYTTTDSKPLGLSSGLLSDTYSNGRGVLKFNPGEIDNFLKSENLWNKSTLETVILPEGVTSIGAFAFKK